jgi:hypothetical protein
VLTSTTNNEYDQAVKDFSHGYYEDAYRCGDRDRLTFLVLDDHVPNETGQTICKAFDGKKF